MVTMMNTNDDDDLKSSCTWSLGSSFAFSPTNSQVVRYVSPMQMPQPLSRHLSSPGSDGGDVARRVVGSLQLYAVILLCPYVALLDFLTFSHPSTFCVLFIIIPLSIPCSALSDGLLYIDK